MRTSTNEARECVVLGHRVHVYQGASEEWCFVVDGEESLKRFATPYAAWAAGAAESYRQGRVETLEHLGD